MVPRDWRRFRSRSGQELIRRPANSGSFVSTFTRGRVTANLTGYFRGSDLDVDPTYGASAGLYPANGFLRHGRELERTPGAAD